MDSPRHLGRSPLGRSVAWVLIATLFFGLLPLQATASTGTPVVSAQVPKLERPLLPTPGEALLFVALAASRPSILAKSAFGELLAHTGTNPQPYAFTGEPLDPNSGWQYHRARWMDSRTGRFAGMDPFGGSTTDPSSLHRYFYSNGDPANRLDPSGRESLAVSAQATAMIMTLSAMSLVALQAARTNAAAGVIDATTGAAFDIYESGSYAAQRAMLAAELAITTTQRSVSDLIEEAKAIAGASAGTLRRWIPRPPKIVPIPAAIIPAVARHVAVAQVSHPSVLTRTTSAQARMNRRRATAHLPSAGLGQSWDEYPFASSLQGGFGASVQVVPLLENLIQGGIIGVSYAVQQIVAGDDFLVVVVP
jgi:RHS repeat-associated protein